MGGLLRRGPDNERNQEPKRGHLPRIRPSAQSRGPGRGLHSPCHSRLRRTRRLAAPPLLLRRTAPPLPCMSLQLRSSPAGQLRGAFLVRGLLLRPRPPPKTTEAMHSHAHRKRRPQIVRVFWPGRPCFYLPHLTRTGKINFLHVTR